LQVGLEFSASVNPARYCTFHRAKTTTGEQVITGTPTRRNRNNHNNP